MGPRFAKLTKFSEKCPLVRNISIFSALPGANAPGKVHSPPKAGRVFVSLGILLFFCLNHALLFDKFYHGFSEFTNSFLVSMDGILIGKIF